MNREQSLDQRFYKVPCSISVWSEVQEVGLVLCQCTLCLELDCLAVCVSCNDSVYSAKGKLWSGSISMALWSSIDLKWRDLLVMDMCLKYCWDVHCLDSILFTSSVRFYLKGLFKNVYIEMHKELHIEYPV